MIRFGTNPIAWSNDDDRSLGADISLERCLDEAAAIGFDGIEKGHKMPLEAAALRALLEPRGLAYVSGWHSTHLLANDLSAEVEAMDEYLSLLNAMGSEVIIICETTDAVHGEDGRAVNDRPRLRERDWKGFAAGLDHLARHAAQRGITLAYHHHMGSVVEAEWEIDRLMAETSPAVHLLLDTGHCWFGGGDPARLARRHMARVAHIHAKNIRPAIMAEVREQGLSFLEGVRRGVFTVPGDAEGVVDFMPVLEQAARHGYAGWLVIEAEQDPHRRDPFAYQTMGLRALKAMALRAGL